MTVGSSDQVGAGVGKSALPASTRMGAVELTVADLERSISYYERAIGLRVQERDAAHATLGVGGEDLLRLAELRGASPARRCCGLYHFALLLPARADLARFLAHAVQGRVPLTGLSDHFVSEAIYLSDPDEHGIEIYWDRPRSIWEGQVAQRMTTLPLDMESLMSELSETDSEPFEGLPTATSMGHVHLRVAEIPTTVAFYRDVLGFELVAALGSQAAFLSAGGYHHHVGANTWESAATGQAPAGSATLRRATIVLPDQATVQRVSEAAAATGAEPVSGGDGVLLSDPSGNPLRLSADGRERALVSGV